MADELSGALPEAADSTPTGQSSDATATSDAVVEDASQSQEVQAEEVKSTAKERGYNLQSDPDFLRYQATQARQINEANRRAQAAEEQIRQEKLRGMNDYEKAQFAAQEATQRAAELEQRLKVKELEDLKRQDMMRLNSETGVPLDMLEEATSYEDAQLKAMNYLKTSLEDKVEERVAQALAAKTANRTDSGGGQPAPVLTQQQEQLAAATDSMDSAAYVAALFKD